jgi:uroporphyrinogen-III synthase
MIAVLLPEEPPMPTASARYAHALAGASVIVTRPAMTATALVRGARARGGTPIRLPGMRLAPAEDQPALVRALAEARGADQWIFTSPAAVHFYLQAAASTQLPPALRVLAVGSGTGRALSRHGIACVTPSGQQNSEGLLGEPALADPRGQLIAILDAPGGRDLLAPALRARGARVARIGVYRRLPPRLGRRQIDALDGADRPWISLVSSAFALGELCAALPAGLLGRWRDEALVVSSPRLAGLAGQSGFTDVHESRSALGSDLLDCACAVLARHRL